VPRSRTGTPFVAASRSSCSFFVVAVFYFPCILHGDDLLFGSLSMINFHVSPFG
jgi:hypothetical protein